MYRFQLFFDEKQFNAKGFRKISDISPNGPIDVSVTSNSERRDEHSHIGIEVDGGNSSITATFHPGHTEFDGPDDSGKNTTEKRVKEIAAFLKSKRKRAVIGAQFHFPADRYEPRIILGHPVSLSDPSLPSAVVSGQEITFGEGPVKKILITSDDKRTTAFIASVRDLTLSSFVVEKHCLIAE